MEFGAEPPVGDSCRFRLLHEHPQIALVGLVFDSVTIDALGLLLRPDARLGVRIGLTALAHFERVGLGLESDKLDDWMALRLGLEKPDFAFVRVVWAAKSAGAVRRDSAKVEQVAEFWIAEQLLIGVVPEDLEEQRVSVRVEHSDVRPEEVLEFAVRPIHVELAVLQDRKANLERLVDDLIDFAHLDTDQVLIEQAEVDAVRLFREPSRLVHVVEELNVHPLFDALDCLAE